MPEIELQTGEDTLLPSVGGGNDSRASISDKDRGSGSDNSRAIGSDNSSVSGSDNSSASASRKASSAPTLTIRPFGFESKTSYDATESLLQFRSEEFHLPPPIVDDDIWKRPPPDFRPQTYLPKPPKRNSRDAMKPWKYGTFPDQKKPPKVDEEIKFPSIIGARSYDEKDGRFETFFKIPGSFESKLMGSQHGQHPPGLYKMPKPHDFRQYPPLKKLGLPEFETYQEPDPYNIHFKSGRLDIIKGLFDKPPTERNITGRQMAPPLPAQPEWEARLIMPKDPWPNRDKSYTRYRRMWRDPRTALMDRMEESLRLQWAREQKDRELRKQAAATES